MNVLVMPGIYSARRLTGVSIVNCLLDMIALVNEVRDDVTWLFAVPASKRFIDWDPQDFAHLERVVPLPILAEDGWDRSKIKDGFCGIDHPWFGPESFKFFADLKKFLLVDVVLSQFYTSQAVPRFQAEYSAKYHYMLPKVGLPAVLNFLSETGLDASLTKLKSVTGTRLIAASAMHSAATVVLTEADVGQLKRYARMHLTSSEVRQLQIEFIPPALDLTRVPVIERPKDRCTFFYGGTFEAKRHLRFVADVVERLVALGKNCRLCICTQWSKVPDWCKGKEHFLTIHRNVLRDEYLSRLEEGDFVPCYIDYEGTGLGFMEAVASGMAPVVLRKPWVDGRIPADYKLACTGEKDLEKLMFFCADSPNNAKRIGAQAVEFMHQLLNPTSLGTQWGNVLDFCMQKRNEETVERAGSHFMFGLVKTAAREMSGSFEADEFIDALAAASEKRTPKDLKPLWPQIRAILLSLGATEKGAILSFKKGDAKR